MELFILFRAFTGENAAETPQKDPSGVSAQSSNSIFDEILEASLRAAPQPNALIANESEVEKQMAAPSKAEFEALKKQVDLLQTSLLAHQSLVGNLTKAMSQLMKKVKLLEGDKKT